MQLIDGNAIAKDIIAELTEKVSQLKQDKPTVAFIRVGEDPASVSYVNKKQQTAAKIGIHTQLHVLEENVNPAELDALIDQLNADPEINGILIQAPLPAHLDENACFNRVDPHKDVDGFSTLNLGKLCQEDPGGFVACTPAGIVELIKRSHIETAGKHVVVLGRSQIVGKPAALLFMRKALPGNATVTVCHSHTQKLEQITRQADILIAAIGRPHFVTESMVQPGAVVIDVGVNRIPDSTKRSGFRLVGDVDFETVAPKSAHITPVPGGVGPMTVAMLMQNTFDAHQRAQAE